MLNLILCWGLGHVLYAAYGAYAGRTHFTVRNPSLQIVTLDAQEQKPLFWLAIVTQVAFGCFLVFFATNTDFF
ncbi:MAG: hypothetical protein WBG86_14080 [Polyangiales bacterium]